MRSGSDFNKLLKDRTFGPLLDSLNTGILTLATAILLTLTQDSKKAITELNETTKV